MYTYFVYLFTPQLISRSTTDKRGGISYLLMHIYSFKLSLKVVQWAWLLKLTFKVLITNRCYEILFTKCSHIKPVSSIHRPGLCVDAARVGLMHGLTWAVAHRPRWKRFPKLIKAKKNKYLGFQFQWLKYF